MLVVGMPGCGKTVALLDAAQHLSDEHDDRFGTPWVFNLGSWRRHDDDLVAWMVRELCGATGPVPGADHTVTRWVKSGWIAPILDGLDEVIDPGSRWRCVQAINTFIYRAPRHVAVVVASRPDEYTEITSQGADRLAVNAAIALDKLHPELVAARLRETSTGTCLADLAETSPAHPVVAVLCVPLWLWIAGTLDDQRAKELATVTSSDDAEQVLVDAYLDRSITELDKRVSLGTSVCRRILAAIAGFLTDPRSPDSTTFRLENLTPPHPTHALLLGLVFGLVFGLVVGLPSVLFVGPVYGLVFGLAFGLIVGLGNGLDTESRRFDGRPARPRIRWPGIGALLGGLAGGLFVGLYVGSVGGLAVNVVAGLVAGLVVVVFHGFLATSVVLSDRLDEGLSASKSSIALHVVAGGLAGGLFVGLNGLVVDLVAGLVAWLVVGLGLGLGVALDRGGWYLLMQRRVRRQAAGQGLLPRDVVPFLLMAVDVGLLRRTAGGVQFRHRALVDRLAQEGPTPGLADLRRRLGAEELLEASHTSNVTAGVSHQ